MVKLTGKKINTAVFISGRGSNLKSLLKFSQLKKSLIKIKLVVSNNKNAKGLEYARKNKIKYVISNFKNIKISEKKILKKAIKEKVEIICLAGFMKILSKNFINKFNRPIFNIHPSLLPKYKGLNTHERVIKNKEKYSGASVHLVTPRLDSGKIILQEKVKILHNDNAKTLQKKVLKIEHKIYPEALSKYLTNL